MTSLWCSGSGSNLEDPQSTNSNFYSRNNSIVSLIPVNQYVYIEQSSRNSARSFEFEVFLTINLVLEASMAIEAVLGTTFTSRYASAS